MKIRQGFISNSSSSSFVILKKDLTEFQNVIVRNYYNFAKTMQKFCETYSENEEVNSIFEWLEEWFMVESENHLVFDTSMDNFDLVGFFELFNIPMTDHKDGHW